MQRHHRFLVLGASLAGSLIVSAILFSPRPARHGAGGGGSGDGSTSEDGKPAILASQPRVTAGVGAAGISYDQPVLGASGGSRSGLMDLFGPESKELSGSEVLSGTSNLEGGGAIAGPAGMAAGGGGGGGASGGGGAPSADGTNDLGELVWLPPPDEGWENPTNRIFEPWVHNAPVVGPDITIPEPGVRIIAAAAIACLVGARLRNRRK